MLALLAAGCAGRGPSDWASPPASWASAYVRVVSPFPVADSAGRAYDVPFLGGYNLPRPQLVDIDGDGDQDLFVQEVSGRMAFFEHVAGPAGRRFVWRTERYGDLAVGEWYRFADMDGDGDVDLLAEEPFSYIRYYRNDGTASVPRFTLAADTLLDVDGKPIFSDRQNIPNAADIDCDGLVDLFLGRLVGTVTRYEAAGNVPHGVPRFRHVTDRFEEIEIVAQFGSLHGANTLTLVDIDGDGDQDFFWGDFFEAGLLFIENTGSCATPALRSLPVRFPRGDPLESSGYNAPAFGDADRDGDLDLLVGVIGGAFNLNRTAADNLYMYEQTARGAFVRRTTRFVSQIDVGSESFPAVVDLDGDGDLDLLLANKIEPTALQTSRLWAFENIGSMTAPGFRLTGTWDLVGAYHYAPAFADLDADGDLDLVLGSWGRDVALYRNRGSSTAPDFVVEDSALVRLTRGSNATPALVDIDDDGDLDLFVGEASGELNFYRNVGSPTAPQFALETDRFGGIDVGRRSVPVFVDLDRDGDVDLVVGRDAGDPAVFRNTGTALTPTFTPGGSLGLPLPSLSAPAFADIDRDGDLDLFAGGAGGGLVYYEHRGGATPR